MSMHSRILVAAAALLAAGTANAAVVTGSLTGGTAAPGTFQLLSPPFSVGNNNQSDNDTLFAFNEKQNVLLTSNLMLDQGGTLMAGTRVASHGVVFDPRNTRTLEGSVTFDRPILGIIWLSNKLQATDALFGVPGITYNTPGARGLENRDRPGTSFVGNVLTINDWQASSPGDNIRVLTAAVPEPATWAMMILGFGLVGFAARRRREAHVLA
jgi:hypothetical protein